MQTCTSALFMQGFNTFLVNGLCSLEPLVAKFDALYLSIASPTNCIMKVIALTFVIASFPLQLL